MSTKPSMEGIEFHIPHDNIFSDEKRCEKCTHYKSSHSGPQGHCMNPMMIGVLKETEEFERAGFKVVRPVQRCDCKGFVDQ